MGTMFQSQNLQVRQLRKQLPNTQSIEFVKYLLIPSSKAFRVNWLYKDGDRGRTESDSFLLSGRPGSLEPRLMTKQEEGAIWNDWALVGYLHKELWVSLSVTLGRRQGIH